MKKISYLFIMLFTLGFVACEVEDDYDVLTGSENQGGLIEVRNRAVAYALGEGMDAPYNVTLAAFQGNIKTVSVDVYKQYTNVANPDSLVSSNKILLKTVTFPMTQQREVQSFTVSYNELIAGLSVNGTPLPASDQDMNVGDYWILSYVATTSDGKTHENFPTTRVTISCVSDLAGSYTMSTVRAGGTTVYSFANDNWVAGEPGSYSTDYIGPYYAPGQTPGSANTVMLSPGTPTSAGFTFTDICGQIKIENQNLANYYTNIVSQTPAQYANSSVDYATGIVTIHYTITGSTASEWISTYTPNN